MSVRLDRMQKGLVELLAGVADNVLWTKTEPPAEQLGDDVIALDPIAGPSLDKRTGAGANTTLLPADSVVVRVTAATVGTRYVVKLNHFRYYTDGIGGDTVSTIRDRLLAALAAGEAGTHTIGADGADGISIVADAFGNLRRLSLLGDLAADPAVYSGNAVLEKDVTVRVMVSVQCYSKARPFRSGAASLADAALDALQAVELVEELSRYGVGIWDKGDVVNLDAIAGGHWESRRNFDLLLAARTVDVRAVDTIETVQAAMLVGGAQFTASASAP